MARKLPRHGAPPRRAFGIFYSSIWQMSHHLSTLDSSRWRHRHRVMVGWLITINPVGPPGQGAAGSGRLLQPVTVLTLIICVTSLYDPGRGHPRRRLIVIDPGSWSRRSTAPCPADNYLDRVAECGHGCRRRRRGQASTVTSTSGTSLPASAPASTPSRMADRPTGQGLRAPATAMVKTPSSRREWSKS